MINFFMNEVAADPDILQTWINVLTIWYYGLPYYVAFWMM